MSGVFGIVLALVLAALPNLLLALQVGICLFSSTALGSAWLLLRRDKLLPAVATMFGAYGVVTLASVLLLPPLYPILVLLPLLPTFAAFQLIPRRLLRPLLAATWGIGAICVVLGTSVQLLPAPPQWTANLMLGSGSISIMGMLVLLIWQFSNQLLEALDRLRQAYGDLEHAHAGLEQQVAVRTADLETALADVRRHTVEQARLLAENTAQQAIIRDLSVPVLPLTDDTLVMPLVGALDTLRLQQAQQQALEAIERSRARRLLLDITGVPAVDSAIGAGLIAIVQAARLLGAEVVLVGIRPEVAHTVGVLGLDLRHVRSVVDVRSALSAAAAPARSSARA